MAFNIRRVGTVAPNSVGEKELKEGAVDLGTNRVIGELPTEKLEDGAVIGSKIHELEINTQHIKNFAISAAKAQNDVKLKTYIGDETETQADSTSYDREFHFVKSNSSAWKEIRIITTLKTSNTSYAGKLEVYINSDSTSIMELQSVLDSEYEALEGTADISYLANGKHKVTVRLISTDPSVTVYSDFLDVGLIP